MKFSRQNDNKLAWLRASACALGLAMTSHAQAQVGQLLWEENFNSLDSNIWNIDIGDGCDQGLCGWGNQELQWYAANNVSIGNMKGEGNNKALILEAKAENVNGKAFTSGKVTTKDKIAIQYGMVEVRMKAPVVDTGLWPAAWMLGTSTASWPAKGEIDIMEMGHKADERARQGHVGSDVNAYVGSNLIFYADDACSSGNPTCAASTAYDVSYNKPYVAATPLSDRFVIYRTYWTDTSIRFTITDNGIEHDLYQAPFTITQVADEFQAPFYLLLNLAVGGNFTDAMTNGQVNAPLPGKLAIDYIRVYQYNGQGEVFVGNQNPAPSGTFGVFTDNTPTDDKLEAGVSADIYVWDPITTIGSEAPFEGSEVISWQHSGNNQWFGGGIQTRQALDMSQFADGNLTFKIKAPADLAFKIGITDTYTNEHWIEFAANTNQYGLTRDGNWGSVTIPVSELRGSLIALQSLNYLFAIASVDGALPANAFDLAIDDIVYTSTAVPVDSDGDGVIDADDNCPNTPSGTAVDANGCALLFTPDVTIEAEDYNNYSDTTAGNSGGAYRSDNVDIEPSADVGGGFNVGWTDAGEWLEYQVELGAGSYDVTTRVASQVGGGAYSVLVNGQSVGSDTVAATGGWQEWQSHDVGQVSLTQGIHTVRVDISAGLFNLNWLNFTLRQSVVDSDGDGVADSIDQCPNTPAGTYVDANGCEIIANEYGLNQIDNSSVSFFVNRDSWADVHYFVNGGGQQNIRMTLSGGVNTWTATGFNTGDVISYWFTYLDEQGLAFDTELLTHTMTDGVVSQDSDGDGVIDSQDQCPSTPAGATVDANGCEVVNNQDSDGDGVVDSQDQCPNTPAGANVDAVGCEIVANNDADNDGVIDSVDQCLNTPAGDVVDATGCTISLGDVTPLYSNLTSLEPALVYDRGDAIVTQFADRARDRHAKEDQFQSYDHYLSHYWTHRTARFKIEDYVSKGGNSIVVNFVTEWQLGPREFRAWYYGMNTVAEYHGNYENGVIEVSSGTYDNELNQISTTGDQYKYQLTINQHRGLNGSVNALAVGQEMEFEVSQFLSNVPEGRNNYYGTTFLYIVGTGGLVPWYTVGDFADKSSERENSHKLDESAWLGGGTTLPYGYTNEPDNHFMQMATNLAAGNGQNFVLGRRVHHTDFETGQHDELPENGIFPEMVGKAGPHYVNASCSGCHERNGRASVANIGEPLDKWVFKVGDANGAPHSLLGRVLQPNSVGLNAAQAEGNVSIASWTENNGLRSPNYVFSKTTPETFSARLAPQLVGLGLLEAITEADILAKEDVNDSNGDGISGKAHRVVDPVTGQTRIGRFGYKAATGSIQHQVAAAFNTDIGVMTSVLPNPDCGSAQTSCGSSGSEIADDELNKLVKYIALLGVRPQRDHDDAQVLQGKTLFNSIGCDGCHTGSYTTSAFHPLSELRGQNIQPYTDLLLHDMGPGLADNLGEGQATGSEWRTAPLWGLGLSACVTGGVVNTQGGQGNEVCVADANFLHDGRARTIEEAILWHGGEGQAANNAYQALNASQKAAVLAFLNSL